MKDLIPTWKIIAKGKDITPTLAGRVISLRITDEAGALASPGVSGTQSDEAEIVIDDTVLPRIEFPSTGADLEIHIGYDNQMSKMGKYIVDEVSAEGPPDRIIILARATPAGASVGGGQKGLDTYKSRAWEEGKTLGDMVKTIASEHGLTPSIPADLAAQVLPHHDQVDESDINLLTRVARTYGASPKPADGKLMLVKIADSKTMSGANIPPVNLVPADVTSWRAELAKRGSVGAVVAVWRDKSAAQDVEVKQGEEQPELRLRHTYPDAETANNAAKSELESRRRAEKKLTIAMPGRNSILAEGKLNVAGFRDGVDGEWLIRKVEHTIDAGGYRCSIDAEVPRAGALAFDSPE